MSLTSEVVRSLFDYDEKSGILLWQSDRRCGRGRVVALAGERAGSVNKAGRRVVQVDGKAVLEHRAIWLYVHGAMPCGEIDHIDGNPLNNSIRNLRDVSSRVNKENQRRARSDSTSGLLGAHWNTQAGKWQARIRVAGRLKHLGYFQDPVDAHATYVVAKRQLHVGCSI